MNSGPVIMYYYKNTRNLQTQLQRFAAITYAKRYHQYIIRIFSGTITTVTVDFETNKKCHLVVFLGHEVDFSYSNARLCRKGTELLWPMRLSRHI